MVDTKIMDINFKWTLSTEESKEIQNKLSIFNELKTAPTADKFIFKSPTFSDATQKSGARWFLECTTGNHFYIQLKLCLDDIEKSNVLEVSYKISLKLDFTFTVVEHASVKGNYLFCTKRISTICSEKFLSGFFLKKVLTDGYNLMFECDIKNQEKTTINVFNQIQNDYEMLFNDPKYCDFKLICSGKEFNVHKSILTVRSKVFSAMFEHDMKETKEGFVEIKEFDDEIVQEFLRYMYCGRIENLEKLAKDLLVAADKYLIQDLKVVCLEELCKNINIENAVELLLLVDEHGVDHLKLQMIDFIVKNIKYIGKANLDTIQNIKLLQTILGKTVNNYA